MTLKMEKLTSDKETQTEKEETRKLIIDLLPNQPLHSREQKSHVLCMFAKWLQDIDPERDKNKPTTTPKSLPKKPSKC